MNERPLPWHVRRPHMAGQPDRSQIAHDQHTVWDDAGHLVCSCFGEEDGYSEAVTIASIVNRAGDRSCHNCGQPATCFGSYEDELHPAYACSDCCAHGNEDGHCEQLETPES